MRDTCVKCGPMEDYYTRYYGPIRLAGNLHLQCIDWMHNMKGNLSGSIFSEGFKHILQFWKWDAHTKGSNKQKPSCDWSCAKQGLCQTQKLRQCTNWKGNFRICELAKASNKNNWSVQLVRPADPSSWSVHLVRSAGLFCKCQVSGKSRKYQVTSFR